MELIKNYLANHLKVSLAHRLSFILSLISQGLYMLIELFAVYALFSKFNLLKMYNINEVLLSFSAIWLSFSFCELFFRGFDNFSKLIIKGDFDILLIRPRNIYLQIFGSDVCYEKLSRVLTALGLFLYSSINLIDKFSLGKVLLLFNMFLGGVMLFLGLFIMGATMCFYTIQGLEVVNIITNGAKQFAEYPIRIYRRALRLVFTFVIPITIINYYPINYLIGKTNNLLYIFLPLISFIVLFIGTKIFNFGMSKYYSTGS